MACAGLWLLGETTSFYTLLNALLYMVGPSETKGIEQLLITATAILGKTAKHCRGGVRSSGEFGRPFGLGSCTCESWWGHQGSRLSQRSRKKWQIKALQRALSVGHLLLIDRLKSIPCTGRDRDTMFVCHTMNILHGHSTSGTASRYMYLGAKAAFQINYFARVRLTCFEPSQPQGKEWSCASGHLG